MIQATLSSWLMGTLRSSMTAGRAVTTTVWSKAVIKAPVPTMVRTAAVDMGRDAPVEAIGINRAA